MWIRNIGRDYWILKTDQVYMKNNENLLFHFQLKTRYMFLSH